MDHVDTDDPVSRSDRPNGLRCVQRNGRAYVRDPCGAYPSGGTQQRVRVRIGRLEDEIGQISRKMDDMLASAAGDFKDDARHRQHIAKDIENEVAIAHCCRRILAVVAHLPQAFLKL
jgi:hypothetical protein